MIDRVALVTGSADRIGAAIARRLAVAGYKVIVHYRASAEQAKAVVRRHQGRWAARRRWSEPISATGGSAPPLIAKAAKPFGPLTLLVNNASTFLPDTVADLDEALWDAHFSVHAEAPAFLARDFAAQLPEGADGNIINMIDERVLHLSPAYFSYALSKATLFAATRTLAQTLAPRIRVNAIGPGPTLAPEGQSEASFSKATRQPAARPRRHPGGGRGGGAVHPRLAVDDRPDAGARWRPPSRLGHARRPDPHANDRRPSRPAARRPSGPSSRPCPHRRASTA